MNENVTRTDVAGRVTVIIVYNDANHGEKTDSDYSTSEAFNRFSEKLGELSGRKDVDSLPKKFDLERYKGILFKDVYTVEMCIRDSPYSNSKSCSELVTSSYLKSFFQDSDTAITTCRACLLYTSKH